MTVENVVDLSLNNNEKLLQLYFNQRDCLILNVLLC